MNSIGIRPKDVTLASVLACCAECLDQRGAQQLHGHIVKRDFQSNVILGTALVDVYGKCHLLADARRAFEGILQPNDISWNVIIRRYLLAGMGYMAVQMFCRMVWAGVRPLVYTVTHAILACRDNCALKEGSCIHNFVLRHGYEHHVHVRSAVVDMYAKCGNIDAAQKLFNLAPMKDVVMSTSIVSGLAACGRIVDAKRVFDGMEQHNLVSWNAMLTGYVRSMDLTGALDLFQQMRQETRELDAVTLGSVFNACTGLLDLGKGEELHAFAFKCGFFSYPFLMNALVRMYSKCGCLRSAEQLLSEMGSERDRYSWNSLISGYERHSMSEAALHALREMQSEAKPSHYTFSSALAACANIFLLNHGKQIHAYMIRNEYEIDDIMRSALIDMYSKCRLFDYSIRVFELGLSQDVILWTSMIFGCAYNSKGDYGLELFDEMQKWGIRPDSVTFLAALVSCICEGHVGLGRSYFTLMTDEYSIAPRMEHYECMIELLGKHGYMVELEDFVDHMPLEPTTAMWLRIFDCCREYGNKKLGERAAQCINESKPLTPVRFVESCPDYECSGSDDVDESMFCEP
jgi:pentatricopeptide repeat protein